MSTEHDTNKFLNKVFNKLKVLEFIGIETRKHSDRVRNRYIYLCQCECGNLTRVASSSLKTTVSCGCAKVEGYFSSANKQRGRPRPSIQKPNGESVLHTIFLSYKNAAKKRGLEFKLTREEFSHLTSSKCQYCGELPSITKKNNKDHTFRLMNGVDRVDSSMGYTIGNCVPCCKKCNYMKHQMTLEEWKDHMLKVLEKTFDLRLEGAQWKLN